MSSLRRYIFLSFHFKETVSDSQIINWIELLKKKGIDFDLIIFVGMTHYFKRKKFLRLKKKEVQNTLGKKIYLFFIIKPGTLFGQIMSFIILFIMLLKNILLKQIIIIQTRTSSIVGALKLLKIAHPKLRIIFDSRGAIPEEFLLQQKMFNNKPDSSSKIIYNRLLGNEINIINLAEKVFFVSTKLKEYYLEKIGYLIENKFFIYPSCADSANFFWDKNLRKRIRQEIGITDRYVLLYSGMLDKAWQIPDTLFYLFSELNKRYPQLFLICLTPNAKIVEENVMKYNINKKNIWSNYIRYDALSGYYCAADAGLLLRDNTITNNVASPTKFAEYIMCGLPVLISERVGDFSDFVKQNNVGLVINNDEDINKIINDFNNVFINSVFDRARISSLGRLFSKQYYLDRIIKIYENIPEA